MGEVNSFGVRIGVALLVSATALTACGTDDGPDYSAAHPRIYLDRNRARLMTGLSAQTPAAVRFKDLVDRWTNGSNIYGFSPWYAALMGQLTGEEKYCKKAVSAVDKHVSSEEALIIKGDPPAVAHDSYLEIGDMVGDAMLVYDWCYQFTSGSQRRRWLNYASQAVWNVWHPDDAAWDGKKRAWSGWSIENPSNNYYYSFLRATMLLGLGAHGETGRAADWLTFFREGKILGELVPTFERDLQGGGSREGTGYGVSMHRLWELYDFWMGSTGEDLFTRSSHAKSSMLTFMHQVVPTLDRVAPTGDHARDSTAALFDYHRNYLLELAHLFPDDPVSKHALYLANNSSVPKMESQFMIPYDFLYEGSVAAAPLDALSTVHYAPGIGSLYARSGWGKTATWINLLGGPFTESHAHQDQGSLLFFKEEWLAYDPNIDSDSGLEQEADVHNLVRFLKDGETVEQRNGTSKMQALHRGAGWLHASVDTKPVYADNTIQKVEREILYIEPDVVFVFDRFATTSGTTPSWQLSAPVQPTISGARATIRGAKHALQVDRVSPANSAFSASAWPSSRFNAGFRLLASNTAGTGHYLNVLSADDAVTSVVANNDGTRFGATVALKDGRIVVARFHPSNVDATLEISGGTNPVSVTLGTGVDSLPAFR